MAYYAGIITIYISWNADGVLQRILSVYLGILSLIRTFVHSFVHVFALSFVVPSFNPSMLSCLFANLLTY